MYQMLGVNFITDDPLQLPVLPAYDDATLHVQRRPQPLWTQDEWDAGELLVHHDVPLRTSKLLDGRFALQATDYASFYLDDDVIVGYTDAQLANHWYEIALLEMGIGIHLGLRDVPVFHGAALAVDGGVVALLAESRVGKSSLTIELLKQGAAFLSDDVFSAMGDASQVYPGHAMLRLHTDTAQHFNLRDDSIVMNASDPTAKLMTDVRAWADFQTTPLPLKIIYLLDCRADYEHVQFEQVRGVEVIARLLEHNYSLIRQTALQRAQYLSMLARLTANVDVVRLRYPRNYAVLDAVAEAVLQHSQHTMAVSHVTI